ncbi:MAG TPA: hypothetical protein VEJ00_11550 [Candidatus Acidoferrales bacterium]|jgi:hypothetical protein|nr:hypothetical protein [Candidatus Acidoferrales bacterium]
MTDYSKMSYEALSQLANNDSIADKMSDEEYESLSIELWRKFGVERALVEHYTAAPRSPREKNPVPGALRDGWVLG